MEQITPKESILLCRYEYLNLNIYYDAYPPDVSKVSHSNKISILKAIFQQMNVISRKGCFKKIAQKIVCTNRALIFGLLPLTI